MPAVDRPLRAVFFDAGNTLLRMDYAIIAAQLAAPGRVVTAAEVERAEWPARVRLDADLAPRVGAGSTESQGTEGRYVRYLLEELGIRDERVVEAVVAWRRTYNVPIGLWNVKEPAADTALALVRDAGLRAAVISNSNGSIRSILDALGLARQVDFVLDSFEVGVEKPDPRIFRLALARAGVAAGEAVYIGDLYSVDVVGARAVGMDAVLLDPGGCWGTRDCVMARDVAAAVRLALAARGPGSQPSPGRLTKG